MSQGTQMTTNGVNPEFKEGRGHCRWIGEFTEEWLHGGGGT